MKYKKTIILSVIALLICLLPMKTFANDGAASSLLNYNVKFQVEEGGNLYFDYSNHLRFFLESDWQNYSPACRIASGATHKFARLLDRNLIVQPKDGYYFSGFTNKAGNTVEFDQVTVDILRVTKKGVYFYNYFPSHTNDQYKRLSEKAYKTLVKTYIKGLYGTSRYKHMDQITIYQLPKKNATYKAVFKKKAAPKQPTPETLTLTYGTENFYLMPSLPADYEVSFRSSSSKTLKVNKNTGYVTIKSPGVATITCKASATNKTLAASFPTSVTIYPSKPATLSAKKSDKKKLAVKWSASGLNSGYEIQVSNNKSFQTITGKKTITSGKTKSTTVQLKASVGSNYVRIRAYKNAKGKKIYSEYRVCNISL